MEYTKGEWKVNDTGVNFIWVESNEVEHVICMVLQPEWAEVRAANYQPEEAKVNARLIAAAPDMYEALKKLTDLGRPLSREDMSEGNKALAKAEGNTTD